MTKSTSKNGWALVLLLLAGIVLGSFIGLITKDISFLSWLNFGQTFGLEKGSPIILDLGVMIITFGLNIKITMASIIGVIVAIIIYKKL